MNNLNKNEWSQTMLDMKKEKWKEGIYTGPHAPLGYIIVKEPYRHLEVEEHSTKMVQLIFDRVAKGMMVNDMVAYLNQRKISTPSEDVKTGLIKGIGRDDKKEWTHKMLIRVLQNIIYIGHLQHDIKKTSEQGNVIIQDAHEGIIEVDVFEKVQNLLTKGTYGRKLYKASDKYEGVLYCEQCGRKLRRKIHSYQKADGSGHFVYYKCMDREQGDYIIEGCREISIEQKDLENQIKQVGWEFGEGELEVGLNATRTKVVVSKK